MFLLGRPDDEKIREMLAAQRDQPFSYPQAGLAAHTAPAGYETDHHRVKLGNGLAVYQKAVEAVKRWEMLNIGWLQLCWPDAPIQQGSCVAVLAHHLNMALLAEGGRAT